MADGDDRVYDGGRFEAAFYRFRDALQDLLTIQPEDRVLDQYLAFRDAVFELLKSEAFRNELQMALRTFTTNSDFGYARNEQIVNILRLELEATARGAEVVRSLSTPEQKQSGLRRLLGRASTVNGSIKEVLEEVLRRYPLLRGGLIVFGELLDLFKGK